MFILANRNSQQVDTIYNMERWLAKEMVKTTMIYYKEFFDAIGGKGGSQTLSFNSNIKRS